MGELKNLTDKDLVEWILRLADSERAGQVELLRYLGELAERKLFLGLGYSSMWDYCRRALKFSESMSQQRILVARAARRHPAILEMLGDGRLTLSTAADLVPGLESPAAESLLQTAAGKSRREVQALTGGIGKVIERDVIRRVGAVKVLPLVEEKTFDSSLSTDASAATAPGRVEPAPRLRVAFTASCEVVAKLQRLQGLLGDAALEEVVEKAADLLLKKVDPAMRAARREVAKAEKTTAKSDKASPSKGASTLPKRVPAAKTPKNTPPRRPPVALRDEVLVDAGQQCEYVGPDRVRCTETRYLSIDHVRPYALGGTSIDQRNLRCLCLAHNMHLGRITFGVRPSATRRSAR